MAGELWNRVNISFPSAVSSVHVNFSASTDANVKSLLVENEKVLKLLRSEILQTEVRVLYELLYILNNSFRNNKTLKGLKQVEQCINRLKIMELDSALQELADLCPKRVQRRLSIKTGKCDVPSQPSLEWLCLKVLGAAQLMSRTLDRCSRAFILSKKQMKWEEFVILNMVITSMLSRLWVICRGILVSLSSLYQHLLKLLKEVANAQPMPFLTDFTLPADMTQFLGTSDAILLTEQSAGISHAKGQKERRLTRNKASSVKVKSQQQTRRVKEDLGVSVERGLVHGADLKPFLSVFSPFTAETNQSEKKQVFKKQMRAAKTFTDLVSQLEERIAWCKSHRMKKEKCLLSFLHFKCRRMKCLEAEGYNVQRKLEALKKEACWASSPQVSVPRTCRSFALMRRKRHPTARFHAFRCRFKSSALRDGVNKKQLKRQRKRTDLSVSELSGDSQKNRPTYEAASHDDIDDIFATAGL